MTLPLVKTKMFKIKKLQTRYIYLKIVCFLLSMLKTRYEVIF